LLIRSHGGAVLNENLFAEPSFNEKEDKYIEEKMRIAAEAAKLVTDGMTIALNAGTTTTQIAKQIKVRENLTVVTNAINIAWELMGAEGVKVFLTGGNLRPKSFALVGTMAEQTLRGIFVDLVFVGVNGISVKLGLTTPNMEEALVNRAMMEAAKKVAVVADHSKFDKVTFSLIATLDQIDMVITDSQTEKEQIKKLQEMGKTVIIA
jgi:DeoR/GlpR family transcriptional regulator of sugar metabolism